jgi:hypothetical protein
MTVPAITIVAPNTTILASVYNTNNANLKNSMLALDDTNYGSKAMTASSKIKDDTITESLLVEALANKLLPVGVPFPFALGAAPNTTTPAGDPPWWPCDGTVIVASSSTLNGLTAPNHNDPGTPATYAPYIKGAAVYNATPQGDLTHDHTGSTATFTAVGTLGQPAGGQPVSESHLHGISSDSHDPLHLEYPYYIKL